MQVQNPGLVYNNPMPRQNPKSDYYYNLALIITFVILAICLIIGMVYLSKSDETKPDVVVSVPDVGILPTDNIVSCDASQDKIGGVCYAKCPDGAIREGTICIVPAKTCAYDEHLYRNICVKNSKLVPLGEWTANMTATKLDISTPIVDDAKSYASLKNHDTFVFNGRRKVSGFGGNLGFNPSKKIGGWQVYGRPFIWRSDGEWKSNKATTRLDISTPTLADAESYAARQNHSRFVFNGRRKVSGFGGNIVGNPLKKTGGWQVYSKVYI
jgi:hypothetical protein